MYMRTVHCIIHVVKYDMTRQCANVLLHRVHQSMKKPTIYFSFLCIHVLSLEDDLCKGDITFQFPRSSNAFLQFVELRLFPFLYMYTVLEPNQYYMYIPLDHESLVVQVVHVHVCRIEKVVK